MKNLKQSECLYPFLFGSGFGLISFLLCSKLIWKDSIFFQEGLYQTLTIQNLLYTEIDRFALLIYVLKYRLIFCVLFYVAFRQKKAILMHSIITYLGFCLGISICSFIIRFGFGGIFVFLVSLFPQAICYFFAIMVMLTCWRDYRQKEIRFQVLAIIVVIIGCILESYVNSLLMIRTLKLF